MPYSRTIKVVGLATGLTLKAALADDAGAIHATLRDLAAAEFPAASGQYRILIPNLPDGASGSIEFYTGTIGGGSTFAGVVPKIGVAVNPAEFEALSRFQFTEDGRVLASSTITILQVGSSDLPNGASADFTVTQACAWHGEIGIEGLDSSGWKRWALAVKDDATRDEDSKALALVFVSDPADAGNDGLQVSNGRPASDKAQASITVADDGPDTLVRWHLSALAMDLPPSGDGGYSWELYRYGSGSADRVRFAGGALKVNPAVYRLPTKP